MKRGAMAAILLAVLPTVAFGQTPVPGVAPSSDGIGEALDVLRGNTTLRSRDWFLQGEGVGLTGETRPRASDAPGVCEWDNFSFGSGPDLGPDVPRAVEVHARTNYGLRAIEPEPEDTPSRDDALAEDLACWEQRDELNYVGAEHAGLVWMAGQVVQALLRDVQGPGDTRFVCADADRCPTREQTATIIAVANLEAVYRTERDCPADTASCLVLEFTDGDDGVWRLSLEPDRWDDFRSAEVVVSWRIPEIVD